MAISTDRFPEVSHYNYSDIRPQIQSGDLLLCSGTSVFSTLIKNATQSIWSHVGFIIRLDIIGRLMVLESVESIGVRTVTLSSYVNNYNGSQKGYPGKILIARFQDFNPANIQNLSKTAVDFLGYPYNSEEIIQIAARITLKDIGINFNSTHPNSPHAFICSEYANYCYQSVGINIPYSSQDLFISPADFAKSSEIDAIGLINVI